MIQLCEIYYLACILFLAGKDATSYRLKDHNAAGRLVNNRIKRWHRDGVALWILCTLPGVLLFKPWWVPIVYSILIRISVFDPSFNRWAGLDRDALGSTAIADKFFVKIFGQQGAIMKMLVFMIIVVLLNIVMKPPVYLGQ